MAMAAPRHRTVWLLLLLLVVVCTPAWSQRRLDGGQSAACALPTRVVSTRRSACSAKPWGSAADRPRGRPPARHQRQQSGVRPARPGTLSRCRAPVPEGAGDARGGARQGPSQRRPELQHLAELFRMQGRYAEAEALHERRSRSASSSLASTIRRWPRTSRPGCSTPRRARGGRRSRCTSARCDPHRLIRRGPSHRRRDAQQSGRAVRRPGAHHEARPLYERAS